MLIKVCAALCVVTVSGGVFGENQQTSGAHVSLLHEFYPCRTPSNSILLCFYSHIPVWHPAEWLQLKHTHNDKSMRIALSCGSLFPPPHHREERRMTGKEESSCVCLKNRMSGHLSSVKLLSAALWAAYRYVRLSALQANTLNKSFQLREFVIWKFFFFS